MQTAQSQSICRDAFRTWRSRGNRKTARVTQSCVDNPEAAAAFLGIDRELIDGIKSISENSPTCPG